MTINTPSKQPRPARPCKPDVGTPEDWARIEAALGFKNIDLIYANGCGANLEVRSEFT